MQIELKVTSSDPLDIVRAAQALAGANIGTSAPAEPEPAKRTRKAEPSPQTAAPATDGSAAASQAATSPALSTAAQPGTAQSATAAVNRTFSAKDMQEAATAAAKAVDPNGQGGVQAVIKFISREFKDAGGQPARLSTLRPEDMATAHAELMKIATGERTLAA